MLPAAAAGANRPAGLKPWIMAARPKTLGAAIAPVLVGSVLGWRMSGQFCVWLMLATLGACICLQIATNFFNDAVDSLKGSDTKERLGPVRITASGYMSPRAVLLAGALVLLVAAALSVPLIWYRGWPILAIGIPSLFFCYGYTGGPMPLAYLGLGELFVMIFFGFVAVSGSYYVQTGEWSWGSLLAGLQVGALSTVLIAINNLRDIEEDSKTGKRTLAVRLGKHFARHEINLLMGLGVAPWIVWVPLLTTHPVSSLMSYAVIAVMLGLGAVAVGRDLRPNGLSAGYGYMFVFFIVVDLAMAEIYRTFAGPESIACGLAVLILSLLSWAIGRTVMNTEPSAAYNRLLARAGALLMLHSLFFCLMLLLYKGV